MRVILLLLLLGCDERSTEQERKAGAVSTPQVVVEPRGSQVVVEGPGEGANTVELDAGVTGDDQLDAAMVDELPGHAVTSATIVNPGRLDVSEHTATQWFARSSSVAIVRCIAATARSTSEPPFIITTLELHAERVIAGIAPPEIIDLPGGQIADRTVGAGQPIPSAGSEFVGLFMKTDHGLSLVEQLPLTDSSHVWVIDRSYSIDELASKIEAAHVAVQGQ